MAVLTANQLTEMRQGIAASMGSADLAIDFTKPQINSAMQAVEDWFEANRPALGTAINTATAPLILTPAQKKRLVGYWLLTKFKIEGV